MKLLNNVLTALKSRPELNSEDDFKRGADLLLKRLSEHCFLETQAGGTVSFEPVPRTFDELKSLPQQNKILVIHVAHGQLFTLTEMLRLYPAVNDRFWIDADTASLEDYMLMYQYKLLRALLVNDNLASLESQLGALTKACSLFQKSATLGRLKTGVAARGRFDPSVAPAFDSTAVTGPLLLLLPAKGPGESMSFDSKLMESYLRYHSRVRDNQSYYVIDPSKTPTDVFDGASAFVIRFNDPSECPAALKFATSMIDTQLEGTNQSQEQTIDALKKATRSWLALNNS